MSTQFFGTWAPSNGFLPIITDPEVQFAAYFVTEPGSFNGVAYALGDWLVYIDESKSSGKWYKSSGGIVSFNVSASSMSPDPGTYTKVVLGQNGNIVDASTLSAADLPAHTHKLGDIDQATLSPKVYEIVKGILANSAGNLVNFKYDDKLKKITADVKIDEYSVKKNATGQLYSDGHFADENGDPIPGQGSGSGGTTTVTVTIDKVTGLENRLKAIEAALAKQKVTAQADSAIAVTQELGGTKVDVRLDGVSIVKNAEGEICVNPALLSVYTIDGLNVTKNPDGTTTGSIGGTCGNATVDADKVDGLEDFVKKEILEYAKVFTLNANEIPIDEDTIIVNADGKLSAVFSKVTDHTHHLKDIIDFPTDRLQWASLQTLRPDPQGVIDFSKGAFDISGLTVGAVLELYNKEFETVNETVAKIVAMVGKVTPGEPLRIDSVSLALESQTVDVLDTQSLKTVAAQHGTIKTKVTAKFFPHDKGTLQALVDGAVVGEFPLSPAIQIGTSYGGISIERLEDYYREIPGFAGTYTGIAVSFSGAGFSEGLHTLALRHVIDQESWTSGPVSFHYLVPATPMAKAINLTVPVLDRWVSGVPTSGVNSGSDATVSISAAITARYAPLNIGTLSFPDPITGKATSAKLDIESIDVSGGIVAKPIHMALPDTYSGTVTVGASVMNAFGAVTDTRSAVSTPVRFDFSAVESRRVVYVDDDPDGYPPNDVNSPVLTAFDPKVSLMGSDPRYAKELQVIRDVATFKAADYSQFSGPDYSVFPTVDCEGSGVRWATVLVPCDVTIFNGYVDVEDGDGNPFPTTMNGRLSGAFIWVSPVDSSTMIANNWLNLNLPYPGHSAMTNQDKNFPGLDLFKSTKSRRWFTFGKRPTGFTYDSLAVRVGLVKGHTLDLAKVVSSLKESIDGQL